MYSQFFSPVYFPFFLFLPIPSSWFWLNQTPLVSCAHPQGTCPQGSAAPPPWGSSAAQAIAQSQTASRTQSQNTRLCFSPGVFTSPGCWKYCSSLPISQLLYFQQRLISSTARHQEHVVGNKCQTWKEAGVLCFAAACY